MHKLFLLISLLGIGSMVCSQDTDALWDSLDCARKEKRFADVARFAWRLAAVEKDSTEAMGLRETAHSYGIKSLPVTKRKAATRAALYDGSFSVGYKRWWGLDMAGYYLAECHYDSALSVLRYSSNIPEQRDYPTSLETYWIRYRHALMCAYAGLGQLDAAIQAFLQEALRTPDEVFLTPNTRYPEKVADFVRILRRRYTSEALAIAAENMIKESGFDIGVVEAGLFKDYKACVLTVRFLGSEHKRNSQYNLKTDAEVRDYEAGCKEYLRCTYLYQYIQDGVPPAGEF